MYAFSSFDIFSYSLLDFSRHGLEGGKFQSDPEFLQEAIEYSHKYSDKNTDQMISLFRESPEYHDMMAHVEASVHVTANAPTTEGASSMPSPPANTPVQDPADSEDTYPTSFAKQIQLNMSREVTMLKRDKATLRSRIMKKVIMGLIAGSLFWDLPHEQSGLRTRLAILFFSNLFLAFSNVGIITPFYRERSVFYSQRESKYYSPSAYFFSKTILELPLILVECVVFAAIIYWMTGLNHAADRFIFYILMLMASDLFAIVFCRFASVFISTEQVSAGLVPAVFGTMVMFTGFVIPPPSIPNWWIWIYYLSPFHYALEGLMINELVGTTYHCKGSELQPPTYIPTYNMSYPIGFEGNAICPITHGEQELVNLKMHTEFHWRWIHWIIMLSFSVFFTMLTFIGAHRINHGNSAAAKSKIIAPKNSLKLDIKPGQVSESAKGVGAFMSWENLSYAVDVKKDGKKEKLPLLQGINGFVRPGMLMALMGPSGAGKSTLLDVLANRKTGGHIEGKILVNGAPRNRFFNRFTAYVEQQDMLMPLATVYETILFSAQTRLPTALSKGEIELRIKDTLHILDLESIQGMMAGALSMEQRKRLTIAVELVSDPQLLFLDEPTSGLDSQAATKVMDVVKRVAETGRAVICTIHQPSLAVFSCFDHLLLLKRGGKTVYFGPTGADCGAVLEYYASIGWECAPKRNPADFILDAAAITSENQNLLEKGQEDPEEAYLGSQLKKDMEAHLNDVPAGFVAPHFSGKYASPFIRQLECNLRRSWNNVRRRIEDLRARTMRSILMGIIIGTLFLQLKHDQKGASDRFGLLFFSLIIMGTSANNAVPNIVNERAVFYREMAAGSYRAVTYLISLITTELPVTLFTSFLLSILVYWIAGLQSSASHFFFFAWIIFLYGSTTMGFVNFLSLATPNGEIAQAIVGVFTSLFSLFAGFIITRPSIPNYWIWLYYFNIMHYPLEAIVVNEMEGQTFSCPGGKGAVLVPIPSHNTTKEFCPITSGNDVLRGLDFHVDDKFNDMGISIGFWFFMVMCSYLALRYIRHIKR